MTPIVNAFTCTGAYALLIMSGIKRVENRSAVPYPAHGRCAVSVSRTFREREYWNLVEWLRRSQGLGSLGGLEGVLPSWEAARKWPGHVIGTIDYEVQSSEFKVQSDQSNNRNNRTVEQSEALDSLELGAKSLEELERQLWNEGYGCWWQLANPRLFAEPIPCRGNVGMWRMPPDLAQKVAVAESVQGEHFFAKLSP